MITKDIHIINQNQQLIDALKTINSLKMPEPLVLFVVDGEQRMVGTLTDGDSRRALIAGASLSDTVDKIMHRNFNYLRKEEDDDVQHLHEQKVKKMKF